MNLRPRAFLDWAGETFGRIAFNRDERAARFIEEALELVHIEDLPRDVVERIVERVYAQPPHHDEPGALGKEIGQAMATLECLAENVGLSADAECEREFARVRSIPTEEWQRRHAVKVSRQIADLSAAVVS